MEKRGVLGRVLGNEKCLRKKFEAVRGTGYWRKFQGFLSKPRDVAIHEEDLSIFFRPGAIDAASAAQTVAKVRLRLGKIFEDA